MYCVFLQYLDSGTSWVVLQNAELKGGGRGAASGAERGSVVMGAEEGPKSRHWTLPTMSAPKPL